MIAFVAYTSHSLFSKDSPEIKLARDSLENVIIHVFTLLPRRNSRDNGDPNHNFHLTIEEQLRKFVFPVWIYRDYTLTFVPAPNFSSTICIYRESRARVGHVISYTLKITQQTRLWQESKILRFEKKTFIFNWRRRKNTLISIEGWENI